MHFQNRIHAGALLAQKLLAKIKDRDSTIIIALPRGGVIVANEIAKILQIPLDILLVKKIGAPSYPELAIGSISENGDEFFNYDLMNELGYKHSDIDSVKEQALIKLQEISLGLRHGHQPVELEHKNIILVDDGIDTGATVEIALKVLKKRKVQKITIATPVASAETLLKLQNEVDDVVVLITPNPIYTIGEWYEDYIQVESEEVANILTKYYPKLKNPHDLPSAN